MSKIRIIRMIRSLANRIFQPCRVRRDAEGELVGDLGEVRRKLLEVQALGAAAGERGVEDGRERGHDRLSFQRLLRRRLCSWHTCLGS